MAEGPYIGEFEMEAEQRDRLLRWAEARPGFVGHALGRWKEENGADDEALIEHLKMPADKLVWLALCRMWNGGQRPEWSRYVLGVACYSGCDGSRIAALLHDYAGPYVRAAGLH